MQRIQCVSLTIMTAFTALATACAAPGSDANQADATKPAPTKPRIEVCFVLDTTGSMSGLIEGAKQKIWAIANQMISATPTPDLRIGLVGYRDRGDQYVTRDFDLTHDIDAVYADLQQFNADGGGDTPESVNEALHLAVTKMSWSTDKQVLKIVFLVGDAPPHMDYPNDVKYPEVCQLAMKRDLVINTVQCGSIADTAPVWQEIARLSEGNYAAIAQSGGMAVIATPMDADIAALNRKLGATMIAYGDRSTRRSVAAKQARSEAAPASVAADRLSFNAASGVIVQGGGELLDDLAAGRLDLDSVKKDSLPEDLRELNEAELQELVTRNQAERADLHEQLSKLAREREVCIAAERRKATAGTADSFDEKVTGWVQSQAARKGIHYGK
jgi:hypothetical protein